MESSYSRGFYLDVDRYKVTLNHINGKMTGIKSKYRFKKAKFLS